MRGKISFEPHIINIVYEKRDKNGKSSSNNEAYGS